MTRVSTSPGRDLGKPLVEIPDDAPRSTRLALTGLRWYLVGLFALGVLGGISFVLLVFVH